jgi:uncharacterized phage protein (predicted DNA packaging)
MYLSLDRIKNHLNIDSDFTQDDNYLLMLEDVAERTVEKHIDCSLTDLQADSGELPTPLLQAMLLFIGDMYANRESVAFSSATEIPFSYEYLLSLYKDYKKKTDVGGIFG